MKKLAMFGYVFKDIETGAIKGTSIDIKTAEELQKYTQVKKPKEETKEIEPTTETTTEENQPFSYSRKSKGVIQDGQ